MIIATALAAAALTLTPAPELPTEPICVEAATRFVNGYTVDHETIAIDLPAGLYVVEVTTWDRYEGRTLTGFYGQSHEQVSIDEIPGFVSTDVPDDVEEATMVSLTNVALESPLESITIRHAHGNEATDYDSVSASVCFTAQVPGIVASEPEVVEPEPEVVGVEAPTLIICTGLDGAVYEVDELEGCPEIVLPVTPPLVPAVPQILPPLIVERAPEVLTPAVQGPCPIQTGTNTIRTAVAFDEQGQL